MAGPMAYAAVAGTAISGVMGFKGQRAMGKAAQQKAEYDAAVAREEAIMASRRKRDEQAQLRRSADALMGSQAVATAASGIQMTGSPLQILSDTYFGMEKDAAMLMYSDDVEQQAFQTQQDETLYEGRVRKSAANYNAYATLLGSATKAGATGYDLGVFS